MPAPIRVSPTAGRSIVVFAPISTSSSMTTPPICGILWWVPSGRRAKPKPSLPIDGAVLQHDAVADADALADRDARRAARSRRRRRVPADCDVRMHDRARADARAVADRRERTDRHVGAERDAFADAARGDARLAAGRHGSANSSTARANARYGCRARSIAHGAASARLAEDDGRRPRRAQLGGVLRIGEEGEIARARVLDAGDAADLDVAVPFEPALDARRDVLELQTSAKYLTTSGRPCARRSWRDARGAGARRRRGRAARARPGRGRWRGGAR